MSLPGLKEHGWSISSTGAPITRFQVFGERSSGTNFVKRLIGRNSSLQHIDELGWKHGFPSMTAIPQDTAIVAVIRAADDWALSMHAKPWHTPPAMQRLPFSQFIRAEWATIADRLRYFPQVAELGGLGEALQHDRHPLTGQPFDNLFQLRTAKLLGSLSFARRGCTCVIARLESVQMAQQRFLEDVLPALGHPAPPRPCNPVVKRLGSKFKPSVRTRPITPEALSMRDTDFMMSQIDQPLEEMLGYHYGPFRA